jgi:hypothetical protein
MAEVKIVATIPVADNLFEQARALVDLKETFGNFEGVVHGLRGTIVITVDDKPIGVQRKRRGGNRRRPRRHQSPHRRRTFCMVLRNELQHIRRCHH